MSTRMLIDARHREETRVAVVKGNRIEEFDFESEEHKQLKGNVYLAKVTRVEPSLQAAFVDYGNNRHGFLAFSEIHPDYYQIPKEDREALLREEAEHAAEEEALRAQDGDDEDEEDAFEPVSPRDAAEDDGDEVDGDERPALAPTTAGGDDNPVESLRQRRMNLRHRYKIQDVIRRRQVLLVQVVKEERGNKGAALTTYLSLAGRYCVLMPNTSHGGGISRKISSPGDRKRLKSILAELNLPKTMGCIVRTAGLQRSREEIRRDFDYLARLWDEIREKTLSSAAPAEIYQDNNLVKRAIRDIYSKDIDEVIVEGEEGYHAARSFMKLLMPTHARRIAPYSDAVPLFQRFGVEDQLAAMYQPIVQLKSGGYLVINPTEALVSIDINSGRSTREHNIEQTATATNLEAAQEIARQLRLRDMAGLIVIDFIDMEVGANNRKVEKAMKEALRNDRARIQLGRISGFGLFEMSRQRLRTGMLEASTRICPHCEGTGFIRTASSSGLHALRLIEEEAARGRGSRICLHASQEAVLYVLNRKRAELADIEDRYGVTIEVLSDGAPEGARMAVEASGPPPAHAPRLPQQIVAEMDEGIVDEVDEEVVDEVDEAFEQPAMARDADSEIDGDGRRRRRRRRRRGGRRDETDGGATADLSEGEPAESADLASAESASEEEPRAGLELGEGETPPGEERPRRGRRGRRGGRRGDRDETGMNEPAEDGAADDPVAAEATNMPAEPSPPAYAEPELALAEQPAVKPATRRRPRARKPSDPVHIDQTTPEPMAVEEATEVLPLDVPVEAAVDEPAVKPKRTRRTKAAVGDAAPAPRPSRSRAAALEVTDTSGDIAMPVADDEAPAPQPAIASESAAGDAVEGSEAAQAGPESSEPARRGWWQRTFGA